MILIALVYEYGVPSDTPNEQLGQNFPSLHPDPRGFCVEEHDDQGLAVDGPLAVGPRYIFDGEQFSEGAQHNTRGRFMKSWGECRCPEKTLPINTSQFRREPGRIRPNIHSTTTSSAKEHSRVRVRTSQPLPHPSRSRAYPQPILLLKRFPNRCHRVIGATGSGKSSVSGVCLATITGDSSGCLQFIKLVSGSDLQVGTNVAATTVEVQLADGFILEGRTVILIDTPGFDDTSWSDTDILRRIATFLATT